MSRPGYGRRETAARTATAVLGGYALAWCFTACAARALPAAAGMAPSEAVMTASMASFVVYLVVIVRVFALRSAKHAAIETLALTVSFAVIVALLPMPARA